MVTAFFGYNGTSVVFVHSLKEEICHVLQYIKHFYRCHCRNHHVSYNKTLSVLVVSILYFLTVIIKSTAFVKRITELFLKKLQFFSILSLIALNFLKLGKFDDEDLLVASENSR